MASRPSALRDQGGAMASERGSLQVARGGGGRGLCRSRRPGRALALCRVPESDRNRARSHAGPGHRHGDDLTMSPVRSWTRTAESPRRPGEGHRRGRKQPRFDRGTHEGRSPGSPGQFTSGSCTAIQPRPGTIGPGRSCSIPRPARAGTSRTWRCPRSSRSRGSTWTASSRSMSRTTALRPRMPSPSSSSSRERALRRRCRPRSASPGGAPRQEERRK